MTAVAVEPGVPDRIKAWGISAWPHVIRWVAAISGALIIFGALAAFKGANPFELYADMWASTFARPRSMTEIFIRLAPITLAALAVVVPARAGMINVGGEGQVILGGIAAAGIALLMDQKAPGTVTMTLMIVAAIVVGGLWAGIAGMLRIWFNVNEAVTTLLLNFIALDLLLFLIYQPWRESAAAQPATRELDTAAKLPTIGASGVHVGLIFAIIAVVIVGLVLSKTRWGFKLLAVGGNSEAARRSALPVTALLLGALLLGGALAGLAGMIEFSGVEYKLRSGFALQLGYIGFLASWLARHKPAGVLVAAFALAALSVAADSLQLDAGLPAAAVNILTALLLMAVLGWTQVRKKKP